MIVLKAVKPPKSIPRFSDINSTQLQMAAGLFTTAWESCIQIMNDVTFDSKCCTFISRELWWKLYQKKL